MNTPKYKNPPVHETVIGVQFPELRGFRSIHFGLYFERIRQRFGHVEDHGRLAPITLDEVKRPVSMEPRIPVMPGGTPERVWYISNTNKELIQLQPDRFLFNWRKQEGEAYPSFSNNETKFFQEYEGFRDFCSASMDLERPVAQYCEVTYINHVKPADNETVIELFGKVFAGLDWTGSTSYLPRHPEAATFNRVYEMKEGNGRLFVSAALATERDSGDELVRLDLTARRRVLADDAESLRLAIRSAHEWVVCGFADVTARQMQDQRWERCV